jgi:hypothetical protein
MADDVKHRSTRHDAGAEHNEPHHNWYGDDVPDDR